jgi:hypothetical protein
MSANLFELIRRRMPAPEARLMETADGRTLTYGDMLAHTGRIDRVHVASTLGSPRTRRKVAHKIGRANAAARVG